MDGLIVYAEYLLNRRGEATPLPADTMRALQARQQYIRDHYRRLKPQCQELARFTSARIEHSAISGLDSLELRLRLSDLEVALSAAERFMAALAAA